MGAGITNHFMNWFAQWEWVEAERKTRIECRISPRVGKGKRAWEANHEERLQRSSGGKGDLS